MRRTTHFYVMVTSITLLLLKGTRTDYIDNDQTIMAQISQLFSLNLSSTCTKLDFTDLNTSINANAEVIEANASILSKEKPSNISKAIDNQSTYLNKRNRNIFRDNRISVLTAISSTERQTQCSDKKAGSSQMNRRRPLERVSRVQRTHFQDTRRNIIARDTRRFDPNRNIQNENAHKNKNKLDKSNRRITRRYIQEIHIRRDGRADHGRQRRIDDTRKNRVDNIRVRAMTFGSNIQRHQSEGRVGHSESRERRENTSRRERIRRANVLDVEHRRRNEVDSMRRRVGSVEISDYRGSGRTRLIQNRQDNRGEFRNRLGENSSMRIVDAGRRQARHLLTKSQDSEIHIGDSKHEHKRNSDLYHNSYSSNTNRKTGDYKRHRNIVANRNRRQTTEHYIRASGKSIRNIPVSSSRREFTGQKRRFNDMRLTTKELNTDRHTREERTITDKPQFRREFQSNVVDKRRSIVTNNNRRETGEDCQLSKACNGDNFEMGTRRMGTVENRNTNRKSSVRGAKYWNEGHGHNWFVDEGGIARAVVVGFVAILGRKLWQKQA